MKGSSALKMYHSTTTPSTRLAITILGVAAVVPVIAVIFGYAGLGLAGNAIVSVCLLLGMLVGAYFFATRDDHPVKRPPDVGLEGHLTRFFRDISTPEKLPSLVEASDAQRIIHAAFQSLRRGSPIVDLGFEPDMFVFDEEQVLWIWADVDASAEPFSMNDVQVGVLTGRSNIEELLRSRYGDKFFARIVEVLGTEAETRILTVAEASDGSLEAHLLPITDPTLAKKTLVDAVEATSGGQLGRP